MYVILVNNDNTLVATQTQRIMQRSKLVDVLWFLVPRRYGEHDMSNFTVLLEYVLPISKSYKTEILTVSKELYNNHFVYKLPIDTELTNEHGNIELHLSFIFVDLSENGEINQFVRKTSSIIVPIIPISAWSDIIPDSALTALDQRIIKTDAQIKALAEMSDAMYYMKADDLMYNEESNELQLTAGGKEIGSKITISYKGGSAEDGVPAVDFSNISNGDEIETPELENNVVEF